MKPVSGRLLLLGTGVAALLAAVAGAMLANSKLTHGTVATTTAPVMAAPPARADGAGLRLSDFPTAPVKLRDAGAAHDVPQALAAPAAVHGVILAAPAPAFGRPVEIGRNGTTNPPAPQR